MTALPTFDEVFAAAYPGRSAFPWQGRLVNSILSSGWPDVLDLPTGLGKTTALDVALYCLAADPARMPRRIVLVIDRRIVVDQGAEHARKLQQRMGEATDGPLAAMATRLRALWDGDDSEPPFAVAVMRGGMPRDNDWARLPDQPVLGVSTVDQIGSRLLFRGYGVSNRSAPIHAGLVGNDTLILLDEVHLAKPFAETLHKIRSRFRKPERPLPDRFLFVQMSATVTSDAGVRVFQINDADRKHPVVAERISAAKRATLRTVKVSSDDEARKRQIVAERAVQEALDLQTAGARVVAIVVNRVDTARIARRLLARHHATTDAELVTGRMRPIDRDHIVRERLPRASADRTRAITDRPLIVVATQCIEAGADLDFDGLVTECASLDALRQRFGRVDRRGELRTTRSVVLARSDQIATDFDDPVYGSALAATWQWLIEHADGETIDFGITAFPAVPDERAHELLPPATAAPVLLPTHLDVWAQTSQLPKADPDIALWLHGQARPGADVQLIWRAHPDVAAPDVERRVDRQIERLLACRPSTLEAVTVPLSAARRWLAGQRDMTTTEGDIADVEGDPGMSASPRAPRDATTAFSALRWLGDGSEEVGPYDLRPGDILVLDAERGGLRDASFDPTSSEAVVDLGDLAQLRGRGVASLRLDREALSVWQFPATLLDAIPSYDIEEDPDDLDSRVAAWLEQWPEPCPPGFPGTEQEWREARSALQSSRRRVAVIGDGQQAQLVVTALTRISPQVVDSITEDDDSAFLRQTVKLADHSNDVRTLAERYASALGFDKALVADLGLAAWLHDTGKADPRFQRWLAGGDDVRTAGQGDLLAKSGSSGGSRTRRVARQRAGYPQGCRHELLSLAMVQGRDSLLRECSDPDLVLHLVASHHGWCRPFPPPFADVDDLEVRFDHGGHELRATTAHGLARLDSDVAPRFWRLVARYGWWGLAWLEAVIRLADHRASEQPGAAT